MLRGDFITAWGIFFVHIIIYFFMDEIKKGGKANLKAGRSFAKTQVDKGIYIILILAFVIGTGRLGRAYMPIIINHDYKMYSGKVLEIEEMKEDEKEDFYEYNLLIDYGDEKRVVKYLLSTELHENDVIIYYAVDEGGTKPVIQINGKDNIERFQGRLLTQNSRTIRLKVLFSLYLVLFLFFQNYLIKKKYKKYKTKRERNNYFVYGRDTEKNGFVLWSVGGFLYIILAILAVIGIFNNYLLGLLMEINSYVYSFGYLLVAFGENKNVILRDKRICISFSDGWEEEYTLNQIISIVEIKNSTYKVIFESGTKIKITIHNEKQRELLNHMKEGLELCIS